MRQPEDYLELLEWLHRAQLNLTEEDFNNIPEFRHKAKVRWSEFEAVNKNIINFIWGLMDTEKEPFLVYVMTEFSMIDFQVEVVETFTHTIIETIRARDENDAEKQIRDMLGRRDQYEINQAALDLIEDEMTVVELGR